MNNEIKFRLDAIASCLMLGNYDGALMHIDRLEVVVASEAIRKVLA